MTKKVYVGNLPFRTTEEDLSNLFSQAGAVESVSIITDRDTGRSKGFAFVSMPAEDADKAYSILSNLETGDIEERLARLERANAATMAVLKHLLNAVRSRQPNKEHGT